MSEVGLLKDGGVVMKKCILAGVVLMCTIRVGAQSSAMQLVEFNKLEKGHKMAWLDFKLNCKKNATKLMKEEMNNVINFHIQQIEHAEKNCNCAPEAMEKHMKEKLQKCIEMHKQCKMKWRNLIDTEYQKARDLADKNDKELADFEEKHNLRQQEL
jgi:hypothetical protein